MKTDHGNPKARFIAAATCTRLLALSHSAFGQTYPDTMSPMEKEAAIHASAFKSIPTTRPKPASEFQAELWAAGDQTVDRDSRVERLSRWVAQHPDEKNDIVLDFNIIMMIGFNADRAHNQPARPLDTIPLYDPFLQKYDHKSYYSPEPGGTVDAPDLMVPRVAIWAAGINRQLGNYADAQRYITIAMDDLQWTFNKRRNDWLNVPRPVPDETPLAPGRIRSNAPMKEWERRHQAAKEGSSLLFGSQGASLGGVEW